MDLTGKTFSNYRIAEKLGAGGMGEVYLGVHSVLNKQVAIKVLPPEFASHPTLVKRFHQEARIMAALKQLNIVAVENMGEQEGLYYIVMEYVEGENLGQLLKREGKIEYNKAVEIITQVCSALSYAHKDNIIHRDIKPSNILISKDIIVKVTDFGIAKIVGDTALSVGDLSTAISKGMIDREETGAITTSDLNHSASTPGTIAYMSPEQIKGESLTPASDLYSLGVVFYEMLVGDRPMGRFKLPSKIDDSIPEDIDMIVDNLLSPDEEDRYQNAEEVTAALLGIGESVAEQEKETADWEARQAEARRQSEHEAREREEARRREAEEARAKERARHAKERESARAEESVPRRGNKAGIIFLLAIILFAVVLIIKQAMPKRAAVPVFTPDMKEALSTVPSEIPAPPAEMPPARQTELEQKGQAEERARQEEEARLAELIRQEKFAWKSDNVVSTLNPYLSYATSDPINILDKMTEIRSGPIFDKVMSFFSNSSDKTHRDYIGSIEYILYQEISLDAGIHRNAIVLPCGHSARGMQGNGPILILQYNENDCK